MNYPGRIWRSGGKAFVVPTNMYEDCDRIGNLGSSEEEWTAKAIYWASPVLTGDAKEVY